MNLLQITVEYQDRQGTELFAISVLYVYHLFAKIREPNRVSTDDVTPAHLVAYDVERDLMPLVLAHCDYSLAVGQGTEISYNLPALEKQIVDRFVVGRPHIHMKVDLSIDV